MIDELINSKDPRREKRIINGEQRRNTRTILAEMTQKVGGSNAYPDPAPKKVGGSGPRKTHRIYAPGRSNLGRGHITTTCPPVHGPYTLRWSGTCSPKSAHF